MGPGGGITLGTDAFKMYLPSWSLKRSWRAFKNHSQDSEEKGEENKIHRVRFLYRFIRSLKGWLKVGGVQYPEGKKKVWSPGRKKKLTPYYKYTCIRVCAPTVIYLFKLLNGQGNQMPTLPFSRGGFPGWDCPGAPGFPAGQRLRSPRGRRGRAGRREPAWLGQWVGGLLSGFKGFFFYLFFFLFGWGFFLFMLFCGLGLFFPLSLPASPPTANGN